MFNFVRERGEACERSHATIRDSGETTKTAYEEIVNAPSTSSAALRPDKKKPQHRLCRRRTRIAFEEKRFFDAALNDDVATLESMEISPKNVNRLDHFGWTALMVAACEGSLNAVKFLLCKNADDTVADGRQRTALSLAKIKGYPEIVRLLKKETVVISSDDEDDTAESKPADGHFYCVACEKNVAEAEQSKHLRSTLHRFNERNSHKFARHFGLPDSNVGFRMMLRQGWNRESGLGPLRDGHLYPVKTVIRKPRSGFGTRQSNKAKVTHFGPFDTDAVKSIRPPQAPASTGRQIKRRIAAERRKERHIRDLLSWNFRLHPISFTFRLQALNKHQTQNELVFGCIKTAGTFDRNRTRGWSNSPKQTGNGRVG